MGQYQPRRATTMLFVRAPSDLGTWRGCELICYGFQRSGMSAEGFELPLQTLGSFLEGFGGVAQTAVPLELRLWPVTVYVRFVRAGAREWNFLGAGFYVERRIEMPRNLPPNAFGEFHVEHDCAEASDEYSSVFRND